MSSEEGSGISKFIERSPRRLSAHRRPSADLNTQAMPTQNKKIEFNNESPVLRLIK